MEHSPPPFFNRGPAPLVRLAFFASLSLALLVLDARFRYTEGLRSVLALARYPLQSLDRLLMEETGLPVSVADDPLTCVVRGSGKALEKMEYFGAIFTNE